MKEQAIENNSIEKMLILLSLYEDGRWNDGLGLSAEDAQSLEIARETETFLNMIPGGFFIYHADGDQQLIYANEATVRIFGCADLTEFRTLTGNSFNGIVHPEDRKTVFRSIEEQISQNEEDLDYVEYRIIRKDGSVRWVEDYGHFVHSEAIGGIYYVFISDATEKISRRLSERREKEEKLRSLMVERNKDLTLFQQKELQRFKVIEGLSANYDTILFADLDTDEALPYRLGTRTRYYFDQKLQVRDFASIMQDYAKRWVHPEDRELVARKTTPEYIRKKLSGAASFYVNYRCIENGITKFLQLRIVNVGNTQHVSQVVLGYRAIDDEILNEMKQKSILQDALKTAKTASVAKDAFLSNMSHDMRTPLNAIFGYTALARKNPGNAGLVNEYLEKIETASRQILGLVDNVLELTYLESQDFRVSETECNVCDVVRESCNGLLPEAERKNITLSLHFESKGSDVFADREKLAQILRHLADNAVKYTKEGGSVDITVSERQKKNLPRGYVCCCFVVADSGIGIGEEALLHIFEPFERESNTTEGGVYGLGLGLTIVKRMVECMGGSIDVESELGKGSKFTVSLDLRRKDAEQSDCPKVRSATELKGKKILIAEDNLINLEIETELLTEYGFEVDSAPNGKAAVEAISSSEPGEYLFVLMDIQMPVMDGRTAAAAIRALENEALAHVPIIALSANAFESDVKASLDAGMNAHLSKPIDIPLLLKTIGEIV